MKKYSEGKRMFFSVMAIFIVYGTVFILFEDYDRRVLEPLKDKLDWQLLWFSLAVMAVLAAILLRYAKRMDARIEREHNASQTAMRRELTQNIAHELKTPVASIKGYMETLLNSSGLPEEMRMRFIERSHAQAERLTALLQDIATLNRLDDAPEMLRLEEVDIAAILAEIMKESAQALQQRSMTLSLDVPEDIRVQGDFSLIYGIFRNLLDNAINYAGDGTAIMVEARKNRRMWQFSFADNGVGVAPEHLPRLFERFYRVDKGRSRQMVGTGLGLAIVKNAVQLHGGTITAQASNGGGLAFLFSLRAL